jgi:3-methylcrotonyl-CoA carboxylase beta subunit
MVMAVSNVNVPRITLLHGVSHGAGNYGMSGRAYDPRFLFAWPNSRISVMSGESAANVLWTVGQKRILSRNMVNPTEEDLQTAEIEFKQPILAKYAYESEPLLYATARLWDDGILDPVTNAHGPGPGFCCHPQRALAAMVATAHSACS